MKFHPPATSPYSQNHRAQLYSLSRHQKHSHKTASFIVLYLLLKFWDKPLLQTVFQQVANAWEGALARLSNTTENENDNIVKKNTLILLKGIVTSCLGKQVGKSVNFSALFLARCLIKAVAMTKVDKVGLLEVPSGIQSWVQMQDDLSGQNNIPLDGNESKEAYDKNVNNDMDGNGNRHDRIVENQRSINRILKYWFGQHTPEKSQKQLWMIASSSKEHMERIDAEIYNDYGDLLRDLSQTCNDDGENNADDNRRNLWAGRYNEKYTILYGWRGKLAAIIVLDQMSRHIHRHLSKSTIQPQMQGHIPEQKVLDELAFEIAQEFQSNHADEISCGMIPTPMMIFALMPLRHRSTIQSVGFVQNKVEEIGSLNGVDMDNMIRRFRRATNRRMAVLQDEARREGKQTRYMDQQTGTENESEKEMKEDGIECSTQEKKLAFSEDDILEFHFFEADMSGADKTPIIRTMKQYLEARGIHPCRSKCENNKQIIRDAPVIVSLSGGVDSMVIAKALAHLRDHCDFKRLYIVAVHIDYGNRPESAAEAAFVEYYARDVLKLDQCTIRRINEVTRGVTKRDEYEKISRNLRYDLYRQAVSECEDKCGMAGTNKKKTQEVGVMLGHHRGDVVENVISNSNKGCGPLDLSGMTSLSKNDGVTIFRPLLPLEKKDVYDFSHKYGVPYFKDTTPHWSTRGKLRNKLVPLLEEIYGDGCLHNLASLAEESDEARALFQQVAFRPFMEKVERYPMGLIFSTREFKHEGSYFWKTVLREMLHSAGLGMFGDKATESFLARVFAKKMTAGWLQCRKDYAVHLMEDGRVAVLYPDSFPWRKSDQFGSIGKAVPYGEKTMVGPWEVSAEITPDAEIKGAFGSWEEFMSGKIQYRLEVPLSTGECDEGMDGGMQNLVGGAIEALGETIQNEGMGGPPSCEEAKDGSTRMKVGGAIEGLGEIIQIEDSSMGESPAPLEFAESFNKKSRPLSWKRFDLKIQSTLPLLGVGKDALNGWITGEKTVVATVNMILKRDGNSSFKH